MKRSAQRPLVDQRLNPAIAGPDGFQNLLRRFGHAEFRQVGRRRRRSERHPLGVGEEDEVEAVLLVALGESHEGGERRPLPGVRGNIGLEGVRGPGERHRIAEGRAILDPPGPGGPRTGRVRSGG